MDINFEEYIGNLIKHLGDDPDRAGVVETPGRVVKAWEQLYRGYKFSEEELVDSLKLFPHESPTLVTTPITVRNISFFSACEHHMLPFFGYATVVYIPGSEGYIGLSKIPKLVKTMAARLTTQETLGQNIVEVISQKCALAGIAIIGRHMCVMARGIDEGAVMSTISIDQEQKQYYSVDSFMEILRHEAEQLPRPTI